MFSNFRYRITVTNVCNTVQTVMKNTLHLAYNLQSKIDKKIMVKSLPRKDEGTAGEKNANISTFEVYPNSFIDTLVVGGLRFRDLPIINIRTSRNNTIINFTDEKGVPKLIHSCGIEGFKNAKKGTNIAAQATAVTFGRRLVDKGINTVKVRISGLGPGRISSIKGLQMVGLNIVSITDSTKVSWNPPRARKQRKL